MRKNICFQRRFISYFVSIIFLMIVHTNIEFHFITPLYLMNSG